MARSPIIPKGTPPPILCTIHLSVTELEEFLFSLSCGRKRYGIGLLSTRFFLGCVFLRKAKKSGTFYI